MLLRPAQRDYETKREQELRLYDLARVPACAFVQEGHSAMPKTTTEASLRGRIAALERWARTEDRTAATAPARRGLDARFEHEVDPDGTLDPAERARRVEAKRRAHFTRLALLSARSRRAKAEARTAARVRRTAAELRATAAELRNTADELDTAAKTAAAS